MSSDQQFCLRWHNYQSSLLASLPQFLDGDDLTDVTLSAGGRSLRAHRVVLSACSLYFKDLFKVILDGDRRREFGYLLMQQAMQPVQHPVIILPGASFTDLCALVTFMYSGEVNIYQEQLQGLLNMADAMQIRGLAEMSGRFNNNEHMSIPKKETEPASKRAKITTNFQGTGPDEDVSNSKPPQTEPIDLHSHFSKSPLTGFEMYVGSEVSKSLKRFNSELNYSSMIHHNGTPDVFMEKNKIKGSEGVDEPGKIKMERTSSTGEPRMSPELGVALKANARPDEDDIEVTESKVRQGQLSPMSEDSMGGMCGLEAMAERIQNTAGYLKLSPTRAGLAGAHSKLFATCLVCGKQLSNQYNLRVHMETHQNVNYACRVCSHVSRSRDALRKHVSYRHPGEGGGTPRVATPKKGKVAEPATNLVQP